MNTRKTERAHEEMLAIVVALITLLMVLLMVREATGQSTVAEAPPARLPAEIDLWSTPIKDVSVSAESAHQVVLRQDALRQDAMERRFFAVMNAYQALSYQAANEHSTAIQFWKQMELPVNDHWRLLAMAEAFRHLNQYDQANLLIDLVVTEHADFALGWYVKGRILEDYSAVAAISPLSGWTPPAGTTSERWAFQRTNEDNPFAVSARNCYRHAVSLGDNLDRSAMLMGVDTCDPPRELIAMPVVSPSLGEVAESLKLSDYFDDAVRRLQQQSPGDLTRDQFAITH